MTIPRTLRVLKSKRFLLITSGLCLLAIPVVVIAAKHSESPKTNTSVPKQEVATTTKTEQTAPTPPATPKTPQTAKTTPLQPQAKPPATPPATPTVTNPYQEGYGYWYVFNRRTAVGKPVGTTWVNPQQWGYYAQRDGYTVNKNPEKWAISVRSSGNILGFVESVNDDGSLIVTAMNYMSGWHKVDTFQIPTSEFAAYSFIH